MSGGDSPGGEPGFVSVARARQVGEEEGRPPYAVAPWLTGTGPEMCLRPMVLPVGSGAEEEVQRLREGGDIEKVV